ncbi:RNA-directed DNA polymerase, eukaryota, reverse transcriptase zinc-binding domain protein, partial [Tanacetum coccineum]
MIRYFKEKREEDRKKENEKNDQCATEDEIWNIRGMSTENKQKEVKKFINDGNLQEWVTNSSFSANSCRIMVSWNPQYVKIQVLHVSRQLILCHIESSQRKFNLFSSFVYASNNGNERRTLWKDLFNMTEEMQESSDCINLVEVEDIRSSCFFYTWTNSLRNPDNTVLKKLDRELCWHKNPKSFRFANHVANKPEFIQTVSEGRKAQVSGYKMYCLVKKLKNMKSLMNKLNCKHGDLTIRVENLKAKLKDVQSLVEKDSYNKEVKVRAVEALFEYNEAVKDEENLLAQKARVAWLDARDKNSAFFHKVIKGRRSRNIVETICDENGNNYDRDEVPMQFVKHFQQFLGSPSSVSELEISNDLFTIVLTNEEVVDMVREVSNKEIKEAMFDIGDNKALGPDDFPQIKGALKKLVQINQSAIIPDRLIQDNILLSQEILRGYGRKNGPKRCAMKIDLQKAYDTISWSFLKTILCRFGFHNKMVGRIMQCVETAGFTICINDDLMIFCHGDVTSAGVISSAIKEFSEVSGLFPNLNKCTLFFGSLNSIEKEQLKNVMQFKEGSLPSKYL